jgi:preprotein translocase subunit SecF
VGDKLDFTFKQPVDPQALKSVVEKSGVQVKEVRPLTAREGQDREYTVIAQGPGDKIGSALRERFGQDSVQVVRTEYVGPQVGKQLRNDGILAVVYAIGMILIYVGFRFDFRFSPGVVIALIHDAIVTLGYFVVTRHEFNLTSVTVILTIVGYSVNDTIVIYDRIRENVKKYKGKPLRDLINLSINEMLGRTILTSGATALSLVGLIVYGVGTIQDFALAMLVGIISGTYSTWYIASPMTIWLEEHSAQRRAIEAARPKKAPTHPAAAR